MEIDDLTIGQAKVLAAMFPLRHVSGADQGAAPIGASPQPIHVIVCTDKRGVVFGTCADTAARPITLTNARMCLYWSADVGGVFGLAEIGPTKDCRISAIVPSITLEGVTAIIAVEPRAADAWIAAKVQGRK